MAKVVKEAITFEDKMAKNIGKEIAAGKPPKQAAAIGYLHYRTSQKKDCNKSDLFEKSIL